MRKPIPLSRIVCVDDNLLVLKVLQWYLETRGYLALPYSSGVEALSAIAKAGADAVVLDYNMPGMNGGELAAALRSRDPRIPIVMFSGEADVPAESLALVDRFVEKGQPNNFSALGDFLDSLLLRHWPKRSRRGPIQNPSGRRSAVGRSSKHAIAA